MKTMCSATKRIVILALIAGLGPSYARAEGDPERARLEQLEEQRRRAEAQRKAEQSAATAAAKHANASPASQAAAAASAPIPFTPSKIELTAKGRATIVLYTSTHAAPVKADARSILSEIDQGRFHQVYFELPPTEAFRSFNPHVDWGYSSPTFEAFRTELERAFPNRKDLYERIAKSHPYTMGSKIYGAMYPNATANARNGVEFQVLSHLAQKHAELFTNARGAETQQYRANIVRLSTDPAWAQKKGHKFEPPDLRSMPAAEKRQFYERANTEVHTYVTGMTEYLRAHNEGDTAAQPPHLPVDPASPSMYLLNQTRSYETASRMDAQAKFYKHRVLVLVVGDTHGPEIVNHLVRDHGYEAKVTSYSSRTAVHAGLDLAKDGQLPSVLTPTPPSDAPPPLVTHAPANPSPRPINDKLAPQSQVRGGISIPIEIDDSAFSQ